MRPKKTTRQPREPRESRSSRRYNKKSFKAAVQSSQYETHESNQPEENETDTSSDALPTQKSSLIIFVTSLIERLTSYWHKIDTTKLGLGFLMSISIILMQYGTRQQTNESMMLNGHSSLGTTTLKSSTGIRSSKNEFTDKGNQAQSQVPIPMEYSHFVELSEFADAVEALRAHREKQLELQNQLHRRARRLQSEPTELDAGQDDDEEETETQKAMDKAWDQTIQGMDSSQIQQMQLLLPSVKHVPFFWHIPRSGGTTLSALFGTCLGLVQAASSHSSPAIYSRWEDTELANRFKDPKLYVLHMKKQKFVNVDLKDFQGVMRAVKGKLISSELADLVMVQDVSVGSFLLEEGKKSRSKSTPEDEKRTEYKGILFAMFRHPIDRAISTFYSKQQVHDVHFDPSLEIYSLKDWASSASYVNDYMVRSLVGKLNERSPQNQQPLSRHDLDVAKEILRRKCLIGLMDEKTESLKRFEKFFGWNAKVRSDSFELVEGEDRDELARAKKWRQEIVEDDECKDRLLHYNWEKKHKHPHPEESELPYRLLESKNRYDIELFFYARQLFEEQYMQLGFDDD